MTIRGKKMNNRGASLVLVIICMLFVGIIAAAILTITTGNLDSVSKTENSSKNFYKAEDFVNDIKMYFQEVANGAATKAYAATLNDIAIDPTVDLDAKYAEHFNAELNAAINELKAKPAGEVGIAALTFGAFDNSGVSASAAYTGNVSISSISSLSYNESNATLNGIEIKYVDANGYETVLETNLVFNTALPKIQWKGGEKDFNFNLDKFVMVSNADITTNNGNPVQGTVDGSLYTKRNIDLRLDSGASVSAQLNLRPEMVLCGNDFRITNGTLNLNPAKELFRSTTSSENGNFWCKNIIVGSNLDSATGKISAKDIYFNIYDDLTLDGTNPEFVADGGAYLGYSTDYQANGAVVNHDSSSAIVLNGSNPKLDLEKIGSLKLYGTAYTQIPEIAGTSSLTDQFVVQGESLTYRSLQSLYLIPGKNIEMRDASGTTISGHNPMTLEEFNVWTENGATSGSMKDIPTDVQFGSPVYTKAEVKYVTGATTTYVYLYWNFRNTSQAVKYFQNYYMKDANVVNNLVKDRMSMIGNGYIKLPSSSVIESKGNLLSYNSGTMSSVSGDISFNPTLSSTYASDFQSLMSSLKKGNSTGNDLFIKMFRTGQTSVGLDVADRMRIVPLVGPEGRKVDGIYNGYKDSHNAYQNGWIDSEGNIHTGNVINDTGNSVSAWKYTLITGHDIKIPGDIEKLANTKNHIKTVLNDSSISDKQAELTAADKELLLALTGSEIAVELPLTAEETNKDICEDTKYIIIATGKVEYSSTKDFNGIIIAKEGIEVHNNVNMHCFANFESEITDTDGNTETDIYGELSALLEVSICDDALNVNKIKADGTVVKDSSENPVMVTNGNAILRRIFDIANLDNDNGSKGGAAELVDIQTVDWKKN